VWNEYVDVLFPQTQASSEMEFANPGDEWMTAESWQETVERALLKNVE
jgi:hypothetical protein